MGISVNTSQQQVTASVNDETVSATVSAGFGASGAAGAAATIAVGTVTTGAAGSQASVTNVGSSSAAVLNFTIPAGATGPQGATGPAGTTTWAGITDKPSEITNLSTTLSGINTALDGKANAADFDQSLQTTDSVTFAGVSVDNLLYVGGDAEFAGDVDFTGADVAGLNYAAVSHQHSATADLTFAGATAGQVLTVNSGATALVWATPTTYTLPQATNSTLGGITVSTGLSVASGALSVSYGTSSGTACQGNDSRLSDARTPTGNAGGDLTGTYPNPTIAAGAVTEADLANAVRNQLIHPFLLAGM